MGRADRVLGMACLGLALGAAPTARAQFRTVRPTTPEHTVGGAARADPEEDEPADPRPAELFPRLPLASAAGWILRPDPAPSSREERAEEELERYFDEVLNEDRLSHVGADPWYHDVMRGMRRSFRPDMRELERERRAGMSVAEVIVDELGRYANGPEPPQDNRGAPPPEVWNDHYDDATQAALEWQDQINMLNAPTNWYRVDLRVTQNPEGVVGAAWVLRTSGYDSLDEAALQAVRDGSLALPPPPDRLVRNRDAIQSDWAFEAADVATYWNVAGCVDDPVQEGLQCAAGGRGLVRTRIRLLRVHDGDTPSFEERRFERRRNPPRLRP